MSKESKKKVVVEVPEELHRAARMKALLSDKSLSEVMREVLIMWTEGKSAEEIIEELKK